MQELNGRAKCNPKEFANAFASLKDRGHIKGGDSLENAFNQSSFKNKVTNGLPPEQVEYIRELIIKLSETFPTVTSLRKAFNEGDQVLNSQDPDTPYDLEILKKIYYYM